MLNTKLLGMNTLCRTGNKSLVNAISALCMRGYADECSLRDILACKIPKELEKLKEFRKQHGTKEVGKVTINMLYGGMRGLLALVTETSALDADRGITFRGYDIPELQKRLPKADGGECPLPEGIFWLMCTGDLPTKEQVDQVSGEWADRSEMPKHVTNMLKNLPKTLHPMAQFSAAITVLNHDSKFAKAYAAGVKREHYWECYFEDSMDLLAKLPELAATIYVNTYKDGKLQAKVDPCLDWSANMALMMGYKDPKFIEMLRLYNTIHVDHGRGNVSAHATHLVGSALSDPYLSVAAGMNGLAGPLHGLANQEVLLWLDKMKKDVGKDPTEEKVKQFVEKTLKSGQVVPGFGHAVLRKTDPRYMCQREFALKHLPDDELFKLVSMSFKVVPPILQATGKVANPWPNVDAHSGCLLQHYGMKESLFYTVLFGVSRSLGVLASGIWDRGLLLPIERPKSLTTIELVKMMEAKNGGGDKGDKKKC